MNSPSTHDYELYFGTRPYNHIGSTTPQELCARFSVFTLIVRLPGRCSTMLRGELHYRARLPALGRNPHRTGVRVAVASSRTLGGSESAGALFGIAAL